MLTPALAEQRRPQAFREREARAAKRKKKKLIRPPRAAVSARPKSEREPEALPPYLDQAGPADMVFEPLYVTASPSGLDVQKSRSLDQQVEPTWSPMTATYSTMSPGTFDAGLKGQFTSYNAEGMQTQLGAQILPQAADPLPGSPPLRVAEKDHKRLEAKPKESEDPATTEKRPIAAKQKGSPGDALPKPEEKAATAGGGQAVPAGGAGGGTGTSERKEIPPPPPVTSRPRTGDHHVRRPSVSLPIEDAGFTVSRELDVRPAPAAAKGAEPAPPAVAESSYRPIYATAVDEGFSLYSRLMAEARRVAADAERRNRELANFHQQNLNDSLTLLDGALIDGRHRLGTATAQLHLEVAVRADRLRARIWGAAEGALGRLAERIALYQNAMSGPDARRATVKGQASDSHASVLKAAKEATGSLNNFAENVPAGIPDPGSLDPVGVCTRDAQIEFAPGHIALAKTYIEQLKGEYDQFLKASFLCLPCELDRAFQSMEEQVRLMDDLGHKAVRAARDGALRSVDDAVTMLDQAIDAAREGTDQGLIAQHDRTRESLIEVSQVNAEREAEAIEVAAGRQSGTLANMAAAQSTTVAGVVRMIERQAGTTPAQFAQFATRSASRLIESLKAIGARQPKSMRESAAKLGAIQLGRARQLATRQEQVIGGTRDGLFEVVRLSADSLGKQIYDTMVSMDEVPGQVGASCNAHLLPADEALTSAVQGLNDAVDGAVALIQQTMDGGEAVAEHGKKVKARKEGEAKAKAAAETKAPKKDKKPEEKKPDTGKPLPAPPSCGECDAEAARKEKEKGQKQGATPTNPADAKAPNAPAGGEAGKGEAGKGESKGPEKGAEETPNGFKRLCEKIKGDPKEAPQVASFLKSADKKVNDELSRRVKQIQTAVGTRFAPEIELLFAALRSLTANQGTAIRFIYNKNNKPDLDQKIHDKIFNDTVISHKDTRAANYDAAINLLNGHATEGAMEELVAAFNFSNEDKRIRDILLSLSPKQLEDFEKKNKGKLDELEEQLDGDNLRIFKELRKKNTGPAKANALREKFDSINDTYVGEKRGDELAKKFAEASVDFREPLEGDKKREVPDIFGLEAPSDAVKARNKEHWGKMKTAFGELETVKSELGKDSDPSQAMFNYATRRIKHEHQVPAGKGSRTVRTFDEVNPYHKAWIGAIYDKGADSPEAKGAHVLVEDRRAQPDLKGLDAAMHSGAGDAQEGGGYDEKARKQGAEEAVKERKAVLLASEKARVAIEGGKAEEDPKVIEKRLSDSFSKKLEGQKNAKDVALGIIRSDEGDPLAVIEYAIEKKKTELALIQLRRMDARQVAKLVTAWNEKYPNGPSIYQKLGIFKNYGDEGAVFEGDEANELEIAFMAKPQNDKERAEIALRVMKQTIDQAGRLGKSVCDQEFKALINNAAALKEAAGITDADIDDYGRIRTTDAAGNQITLGNFDAKGNFIVAKGGNVTPFETAIAMAKVTASSYTEAVDRASNTIATILVVIAAVITTALTLGAGAAIWLPVLVTLGAGALSMYLTYEMRGKRYTRSEMLRDAVMTIAQAATAGLGAAVGAGLRGGAGALRAAATSLKVSEAGFKAAAGTAGMRSLTLLQELAIGAGSGAVMGGVGAAVDPTARRSDNYVAGIFHGIFRGALGGAAGAGVARGVTGGLTGLARGLGASSGAAFVLGRGGSLELAARVAAMRAKAFSTSALTTIGVKTAAQALSGVASVSTEMAYERGIQGKEITAAQALDRIADAFWQNAIQGMLEGVAERGMVKFNRKAAAYHALNILEQQPLFDAAARDAVIKAGVKRGLLPPSADRTTPPSAPTVPATPIQSGEPEAAPRPAAKPTVAVDANGAALPLPRPGDTEAEQAARGTKSTEPESELRPSRARPSGEAGRVSRPANENESVEMLRSAIGPHDEEPMLRSASDEKTNPEIRIPVITEFPNGIDLKPGMLQTMPPIAADVIVRPINPTDGTQARQNYDLLRTFNPGVEALLAYNPSTGQYTAKTGFPGKVRPMPPPWVTLRHSHGKVVSADKFELLTAVLPSGIGGDFQVLRSELERFPVRDIHQEIGRQSSIDIEVNGVHVQTTFEITRKGDNYSLSVTIDPPVNGVSKLGPYTGDRDTALKTYAEKARDATSFGSLFGLDKDPNAPAMMSPSADRPGRTSQGEQAAIPLDPARRVGGEQAALADTLTQTNREDAAAIARRMETQIEGDPVFATSKKDDQARYEALQRVRTPADVQEAVTRMGLVDRPDAMIRLQAILSDPTLTRPAREQIARAVFEATRESMRRSGALAEGDDLVMFFHGAPETQVGSYQRGGIDMGLALPRAGEHDLGPGTYVSRDFQSALLYVEAGGRVLPSIIPRSRLGNVIDIAPGSPMRARWEAFVLNKGGSVRGAKLEYSPEALKSVQDAIMRRDFGFRPPFDQIKVVDGRGQLVEAFLAHLADDAKLPESVRAAARSPDIILTDLGGGATSGNTRGFVTDQAAIRSQRLADIMAEQLGFPRLGPPPDLEMAQYRGPQRTTEADQAGAATPKPTPAEETQAVPAKPRAADDDVNVDPMTGTRYGAEDPMKSFHEAVAEASVIDAPPAPRNGQEAHDRATPDVKQAQRQEALARFSATWPSEGGRLAALAKHDPESVMRALRSPNELGRTMAARQFEARMIMQGSHPDAARRLARQLIEITNVAGPRYRENLRHVAELQMWSDRLAALPAAVRAMAEKSPLLIYLAARHPALLQSLHTQFLAQPNLKPAQQNSMFFEDFVARRLTGHPAIQAETTDRRIVRFTSEDAFNEAAARAAPHTRYEFGKLAYTTDAQGRVAVAEGVPERVSGHRGSSSLQTAIGNTGRATDVGFHLIAHIFGAVVNELTVVPGNGKRIPGDPDPNLNGSAYKVQFENIVRNVLDTTKQIEEVEVRCLYDAGNNTNRPDHFQVRFRTDAGTWVTVTFLNKF